MLQAATILVAMASKEKKLATKLVAKVAYLAMYQGVKSSYAPINVKPAGGGRA